MNEPKLKSAREWMAEMSGLEESALLTVNRSAIRDIQLDAIKYGIRLASEQVDTIYADWHSSATATRSKIKEAILTAAENMKEVPSGSWSSAAQQLYKEGLKAGIDIYENMKEVPK